MDKNKKLAASLALIAAALILASQATSPGWYTTAFWVGAILLFVAAASIAAKPH